MKKLLVPLLTTATLFFVAPSALAASKSESIVDTTTVTTVDATEVTPIDTTIEIAPRATTVSWSETIDASQSVWSDVFYISSSKSSLKLNQVLQATLSWSTPAKVEYRLYKQSSGSTYTDTGIYDVLDGTYTYPNAGPCTLYGTISSGTYKIKMINKTSVKTTISGNILI